jgi:hypothetical protein
MKIRVPLWLALSACVGCLALGSVRAQAPPQAPKDPAEKLAEELLAERSYPYLPKEYAGDYGPSVADWQALRMTAMGASPERATEHFTRQQCSAFLASKGLAVKLDLVPDPDWKHYAGGGKFSAPLSRVKPDLERAAEAARDFTRTFFQEVQDKDLAIIIHIRGERVGLWNAGSLVMEAEKPGAK